VRNPRFLVLLLAVTGAVTGGEIAHLSSADRSHLLDDRFRTVLKVAELPPEVLAAFERHTKQSPFRMADPGEEFQVTDVIMKPNLPIRRLVFAGVSERYCVVNYESGGIVHVWWVVLFKLSPPEPATAVWVASPDKPGPFKSLDDLRQAVRKGELRDGSQFW
jgi:hypothetical protein